LLAELKRRKSGNVSITAIFISFSLFFFSLYSLVFVVCNSAIESPSPFAAGPVCEELVLPIWNRVQSTWHYSAETVVLDYIPKYVSVAKKKVGLIIHFTGTSPTSGAEHDSPKPSEPVHPADHNVPKTSTSLVESELGFESTVDTNKELVPPSQSGTGPSPDVTEITGAELGKEDVIAPIPITDNTILVGSMNTTESENNINSIASVSPPQSLKMKPSNVIQPINTTFAETKAILSNHNSTSSLVTSVDPSRSSTISTESLAIKEFIVLNKTNVDVLVSSTMTTSVSKPLETPQLSPRIGEAVNKTIVEAMMNSKSVPPIPQQSLFLSKVSTETILLSKKNTLAMNSTVTKNTLAKTRAIADTPQEPLISKPVVSTTTELLGKTMVIPTLEPSLETNHIHPSNSIKKKFTEEQLPFTKNEHFGMNKETESSLAVEISSVKSSESRDTVSASKSVPVPNRIPTTSSTVPSPSSTPFAIPEIQEMKQNDSLALENPALFNSAAEQEEEEYGGDDEVFVVDAVEFPNAR
jgi:hypothetical protein